MVVLFLIFWGTSILFSIMAAHYVFPPQCSSVPFSPCPYQHLLSFLFFDNSYPDKCKVIPHCVLIWISLIISDSEHFFIYLLTIYMSSLKKCLFKSLANFVIRLWVWVLFCCCCWCWVGGVPYIFWRLIAYQIHGLQIFSPIPSVGRFTLLIVSFVVQNLFSLM